MAASECTHASILDHFACEADAALDEISPSALVSNYLYNICFDALVTSGLSLDALAAGHDAIRMETLAKGGTVSDERPIEFVLAAGAVGATLDAGLAAIDSGSTVTDVAAARAKGIVSLCKREGVDPSRLVACVDVCIDYLLETEKKVQCHA